jgi:hypothetical protein
MPALCRGNAARPKPTVSRSVKRSVENISDGLVFAAEARQPNPAPQVHSA